MSKFLFPESWDGYDYDRHVTEGHDFRRAYWLWSARGEYNIAKGCHDRKPPPERRDEKYRISGLADDEGARYFVPMPPRIARWMPLPPPDACPTVAEFEEFKSITRQLTAEPAARTRHSTQQDGEPLHDRTGTADWWYRPFAVAPRWSIENPYNPPGPSFSLIDRSFTRAPFFEGMRRVDGVQALRLILLWPGYDACEFAIKFSPQAREREVYDKLLEVCREWHSAHQGDTPEPVLCGMEAWAVGGAGIDASSIHVEGLYRSLKDPDWFVVQCSIHEH